VNTGLNQGDYMSILDKLRKASTIKEADVLSDSKFFNKKDMIQTSIPMLNVALSGSLDGGITPGLTLWCGPSKHFKSFFCLLEVKAYLDKYPEAICLFYDSEFGAGKKYFETIGIDTTRVIHSPITDVEQFKFDVMQQLEVISRGDKVIIFVDSVGNLASKKEVDDAKDGKSVADMSRAKQIKSVFRMITPHLNIKDIPMVVVNHTYQTQEMYSKAVVSGGTGIYYSADTIFIIGRQQEKDGTEVTGYNFIINVEKSRHVREKSKIPIEVRFEGGISTWSGLLDVALDSGHVIKPKNGWYQQVDMETGEVLPKNYRRADTDTKDFWLPVLKSKSFRKYIEDNYRLAQEDMVSNEDISDIYGEAD